MTTTENQNIPIGINDQMFKYEVHKMIADNRNAIVDMKKGRCSIDNKSMCVSNLQIAVSFLT